MEEHIRGDLPNEESLDYHFRRKCKEEGELQRQDLLKEIDDDIGENQAPHDACRKVSTSQRPALIVVMGPHDGYAPSLQ